MEIQIVTGKSNRELAVISNLAEDSNIQDLKKEWEKSDSKTVAIHRQAFRSTVRGKLLKDSEKIDSLGLEKNDKGQFVIYFKDLGPQVGWTTVFLTEYAGPLIIYLIFYFRPGFIYTPSQNFHQVVHIAAGCWTFHYAKRLYETVFVHRFSNATMPITNIFKNSTYYWGFAAWVAYYVNHPLYTPPSCGQPQIYGALAVFVLCELGNLSIHMALRDLRPPGTKERRIPYPTGNPLTGLFSLVSCPNYTYEIGAWLSFSIMTQTLPALLFALAGFYQMAVWALGKHRNYRREFPDYPRDRKAILPFVL